MHHQHIDETQIMQQNLHKLIKNQNYFSCFIETQKQQEQPTNPFQKKLFDKNLRRSTISCGHYNSTSNNLNSQIQDQSNRFTSSRRNSLTSNSHNQPIISQSNLYTHSMPQPRIQTAHKISLAQSRHSDPTKQQVTQIINNFRLELDYLEEKLHHKVDQLNCRYGDRECNEKDREAEFMIESLEKIVGFMIENCVNLEDSVMYGGNSEQYTGENSEQNTGRNTEQNTGRNIQVMRKQVYQIEEDQNQNEQNMSFSNQNTAEQFKPTQRFINNNNTNGKQNMVQRKRKIIGLIEKENINSNNNHEEDLPQTYYVNNKIHSTQNNTKPSAKNQYQTTRPTGDQTSKPTKRAPSKSSNQKPIYTNTQNEQYHYHSSKQSQIKQPHSSSSLNENSHVMKSIYETVLEEREMRLKMKKKLV